MLKLDIQLFGGRGASSSGGVAIPKIDGMKAGANFRKLPQAFKNNIEEQLKPSRTIMNLWKNGNKNNATDEWTVGIRGVKEKQKVIMSLEKGKVTYTIKRRNKILLKTTNRNQTANKIAEYYNTYLKELKK